MNSGVLSGKQWAWNAEVMVVIGHGDTGNTQWLMKHEKRRILDPQHSGTYQLWAVYTQAVMWKRSKPIFQLSPCNLWSLLEQLNQCAN